MKLIQRTSINVFVMQILRYIIMVLIDAPPVSLLWVGGFIN